MFSRTDAEHRVQTRAGAIISIVAMLVMFFLFVSELWIFLGDEIQPELSVDTSLQDKIHINFDIVFPSLSCALISVNAMDKTGDHQLNIHHSVQTTRLTKDGKPVEGAASEKEVIGEDRHLANVDLKEHFNQTSTCGDCYGAQTDQHPCCNTCAEVKEAYRRKGWALSESLKVKQCVAEGYISNIDKQKQEGCRVHGFVSVNRVAGNVNIVPGKFVLQNTRYVMDTTDIFQFASGFNLSHTIHKLSFGDEYPGMKNPLDRVQKVWVGGASAMYQYFIKVVPTLYSNRFGTIIKTNQYSVLEYLSHVDIWSSGVPGVFFSYDLSPIRVDLRESKSFLHFLTNLCAIIGGVFTVASLVDAFVYQGWPAVRQKILSNRTSSLL